LVLAHKKNEFVVRIINTGHHKVASIQIGRIVSEKKKDLDSIVEMAERLVGGVF
jgi:hypothetical protein